MAKFEIDEFGERLTDNCVQQIEINTKKDTAFLCLSLIWTLYFDFFQGCGAYQLVVMYFRLLEIFLNLSDIRSDRKIHHVRPDNFLSDKFLFCVEHLEFCVGHSDWQDFDFCQTFEIFMGKTDKTGTFQEHCILKTWACWYGYMNCFM